MQGQQVFFSAQVARTAQQFQIKDDVLIFHHLARQLAQRVQHAGGKHIDIARLGGVGRQARLHDAAPFFDKHQLHAVLPVQRHLGKILRDRAGIDVEREPRGPVLLCFAQGFLIWHDFHLVDSIVPLLAIILQASCAFCVV